MLLENTLTRFPAGSLKIIDRLPQGWVVGGITQSTPELANGEQAGDLVRAAFSPVQRAMFGALGIRQFLLLHRELGVS